MMTFQQAFETSIKNRNRVLVRKIFTKLADRGQDLQVACETHVQMNKLPACDRNWLLDSLELWQTED